MHRKVKIYLFSSIIFGILLSAYATGFFLHNQANLFVKNLSENLSLQIGHPVRFSRVSTSWDWIYFKVQVQDIDSSVFNARKAVGTVDVINSLLQFRLQFKNLLLDSPKLDIDLAQSGNDAVMLKFLSMQRSVTIKNGDINILSLNGRSFNLKKVKLDFKKKSDLVYLVVLQAEIADETPQEFSLAVNYYGKLDNYAAATIDLELNASNLNLFGYREVSGKIKELSIRGSIHNNKITYINSSFSLDNIALNKINFVGGDGKIEFRPQHNKTNLSLLNTKANNINIDSVLGEIYHTHTNDGVNIFSNHLKIKTTDMVMYPKIQALIKNDQLESFDAKVKIVNGSPENILKLIPENLLKPAAKSWLQRSIVQGQINDTFLKYENNRLLWQTDLTNAEFKYSALWPSITDINASFILDGDVLSLHSKTAKTLGYDANELYVKFLTVENNSYSFVKIHCDMDANLEAGVKFLQATPLKQKIGDKLANFVPQGPMHLELDLAMDLNQDELEIKTVGSLKLKDNNINVNTFNVNTFNLTNITGDVNFTNNSLNANDIRLKFLGNSVVAHMLLDPKTSNNLNIKAKGPLVLDFKHLNGTAEAILNINIPMDDNNKTTDITLQSDLLGVNIDLPPPLGKTTLTKTPIMVKYAFKTNSDPRLYIKFKDLMDANVILVNGLFAGGHISFGADNVPFATRDQIFISGKLEHINLDLWEAWFLHNKTASSAMPVEVDLLFNNLLFRGTNYNDTWIKYDSAKYKLALENSVVKGIINFGKDFDSYNIKLDYLDLATLGNNNGNFVEVIKNKHKKKQLPIIQFYAENLRYQNKNYKKVNAQLLPRMYGYEITDCGMQQDNILLQAQGQWQMDGKEYTTLSGNAYIKDFGRSLKDFGLGNSISKGNGEVNFALRWDGNPGKFNILNIEGNSHLELKAGTINEVKPGLGRILGLLNLGSIQRRLQLDFSDLFGKGLAFDKLESDLKFKSGTVVSDKIQVNSPSARIELQGQSDLKTQELDLTMFVIPKIGVGIPVAAAIAVGNPAVGAALWLFDQAAGAKLSEITKYKYKVAGTWTAPKIDEIVANK